MAPENKQKLLNGVVKKTIKYVQLRIYILHIELYIAICHEPQIRK